LEQFNSCADATTGGLATTSKLVDWIAIGVASYDGPASHAHTTYCPGVRGTVTPSPRNAPLTPSPLIRLSPGSRS
jgi:hypothetical protein